ncbi:hypothetical protein UM606_06950 [Staphylococcus aureus]|nr:hypothetical protein UM606_06950 [Staphylococcus aureus]
MTQEEYDAKKKKLLGL